MLLPVWLRLLSLERRGRERWERPRREREARERNERRLAEARQRRDLCLDVGSSSLHLAGWISLDLSPDELGIQMDATRRWPFADGSARAVRSEHTIEHMAYDDAVFFVHEIYRVLRPGGVCRICTPDLEGTVNAYLERDPHIMELHLGHGYVAPSWAHLVNNYMRMWGHEFTWDFDSLAQVLRGCGFTEIERVGFGESRHAVLAGTDSHDVGDLEPLVLSVDAVKPPA
jgi:predicted SAM-dependent methyltransferase